MNHFRRVVLPVLGLALMFAACGTSSDTGAPQVNTTQQAGPVPTGSAAIDVSHATLATPDPTDTKVTLNPKLYTDPNDPCAVVTATTGAGQVPSNCGVMFVGLGSPVVPGPDKVDGSAEPKTARVAKSIDPAKGTTIGNAFFVAQVVRFWALELNVPSIIPRVDGLFAANDAVYKQITSKPVLDVQVPQCAYPTDIRVIAANSDVQNYLAQLGWPAPSGVAVVANYDQCPGVHIDYKDGSSAVVLGHDKPVSIVATGGVVKISPFGMLWLQDGWSPCGPAALASVC